MAPFSKQSQGLRAWLAKGGTYSADQQSKTTILLRTTDLTWREANGFDTQRYFLASKESILPRIDPRTDERAIGWAVVSTYYSTFYLTLGLLRAFGRGLISLGAAERELMQVAAGDQFRIDAGTYSVTLSLGTSASIALKKADGKGYHEKYWRLVDGALAELEAEVARGEGASAALSVASRGAAMQSVDRLRDAIGNNESPDRAVGWMSRIRNEVSYRFERSTWPPFAGSKGVTVQRLRDDVAKIVKGDTDCLGRQIRIDDDVRAMIEKSAILHRDLSQFIDTEYGSSR
jgi:hypothetical protein